MNVPLSYGMRWHGKPCHHCKRTMDFGDADLIPTRDHYPVPFSKGGRKIVPACHECNNLKGNMDADQWHQFMRDNPEWWGVPHETKEERRRERQRQRAKIKEIKRTEKWGPRNGVHYSTGGDGPSNPMTQALASLAPEPKICDKTLAAMEKSCETSDAATFQPRSLSNMPKTNADKTSVDMSSEATRTVRNVEQFENEIANYVNAAVGLILVRTREPVRCAEWLNRIAIKREAKFKLWACNRGWQHAEREQTQREGEEIRIDILSLKGDMSTVDLSTAFKSIFDEHNQRRQNSLMGSDNSPQADYYALFYPHHHFDKPLIHAWIKDFGQLSREADKRMFLIVPETVRVPAEIEDDLYIMDFMVPSFAELHDCWTAFIKTLPDGAKPDFSEEEITKIVQNGLGMTHLEFETAAALAVVTYEGPGKDKSSSDDYVKLMLNHKIEVIKKTDLLELMPPENMDNVGGFDDMKEWLEKQSMAFSEEARDYGIEKPKGILCVGPPGTGKSLFSKATANKFGVPLVKFDIGKVFGKFVGESEGRVRQAIKIIEAMAPCVLLVDEIDKGFGGLSGGGTDGGTSMRVLGSFLNWMQDRDTEKYPVFIVMTANNVQGLPPELMRRGRIDEIFACTFPGVQERRDIAKIHLKKRGHNLPIGELNKIAEACPQYVGAEIEAAVKNALLDAYCEGAERPTGDHVVKHLKEMVPLSVAFADKMRLMNEWAAHNAKPASSSMKFTDDAAPTDGGTTVKPRPSRSINIPGKGGIKGRSLDG